MQVSSIADKGSITIFTDGSCHSQLKKGGWAAIILFDNYEKIVLQGHAVNTTHQRMEITAVLEALLYLEARDLLARPISIYSDSQYVVDLLQRRKRLALSDFKTKSLKPIRNDELVKRLIAFMEMPAIKFFKLKSHLKNSDVETLYNREVDRLSRKIMRKHD